MSRTEITRRSDTELVVTRVFDAPASHVFAAWTRPDLMMRWWAPRSMGMELTTCEIDARTGGSYRLRFSRHGVPIAVDFVGSYLEVTPHSRIVWTNEEEPGGAVTTVTLTERDGRTYLELVEAYPNREALEANRGAEEALPAQFTQLDSLLAETQGG